MAARTIAGSRPSGSLKREIPVRRITGSDVNASLTEGWRDFMEMRGDIIFLMILYPLIGIVAAVAFTGGPLLPLFLPIAAGIGLLGPGTHWGPGKNMLYLGKSDLAQLSVLFVHVWRTLPLATIILLAGLTSIPRICAAQAIRCSCSALGT